MKTILTTPRLRIRQFAESEWPLFIGISEDPEVMRFITPRTPEQNRELFEQMMIDYLVIPEFGRWGIFDVETGDFIGLCMLLEARPGLNGIELGYSFHYEYWNKGYATELVKALVNYGLYDQDLPEICAITNPENMASQRVLEKAGFTSTETVFLWEKNNPLYLINRADQ
ncbi:GNAT family N-acetyltransferase [Mucilaginibacter agri]|uniref:GNAT family N-acetyltransferase n=1 Tax=Mucilaginibacter agri TaxID=2695265 RepID=A0A965ZFW3_9SPHI|nr:GNAT family N-acetyltransferase [Mucilaginibacter agri]NCD69448.1 GNAT family N-acetyltransferase [Mucilaginibacter agri]